METPKAKIIISAEEVGEGEYKAHVEVEGHNYDLAHMLGHLFNTDPRLKKLVMDSMVINLIEKLDDNISEAKLREHMMNNDSKVKH